MPHSKKSPVLGSLQARIKDPSQPALLPVPQVAPIITKSNDSRTGFTLSHPPATLLPGWYFACKFLTIKPSCPAFRALL